MKNMQKYIAEPENMQFSVSPDFFGGGQKCKYSGFLRRRKLLSNYMKCYSVRWGFHTKLVMER